MAGFLAEDRLEVGRCDRTGVERAQPFLQPQGSEERLLNRHLLVERESDQQRHGVVRDQLVGLVGVGEMQAIGHGAILA